MDAAQAELPGQPPTIPELLRHWAGAGGAAGPHVGSLGASSVVDHVGSIGAALFDAASSSTTSDRPVIAYETPTGIEGALLFLAAASVGVAAPLRPGLTPAEESRALALIDPDLFLRAEPGLIDALLSTGQKLDRLVEEPAAQDLALILTTSGTTGKPKRVGLDHARLVTSARNIADWFELGPADHSITVMPLFHIHGLVAGVLAPLAGAGSVTPVPFDAFSFGKTIGSLQPTWCSAVPSMWELILRRWRERGEELRAAPWRFLRTSSSALPATLLSELESVFRVPVLEAYGMTEAAHQITANPLPPGRSTANSVGFPTGDTEVRILDPDASGEGPIQIKGPTIIDGYLSGEAPESFDDGWFSTGDQGRVDPDGRLFITGRISEFINRGGDKISPHEIEQALATHPAVERVVAFPLPHPILGQVPAAAVVLIDDAECDVPELQDHIAGLLSRPKRPMRLEIIAEWPLGPTGKLQRRFLGEQLGWTSG